MMGTIKPSKYQEFVARDSNMDSKENNKDNKPPDQKGDKSKSHEESSPRRRNTREER